MARARKEDTPARAKSRAHVEKHNAGVKDTQGDKLKDALSKKQDIDLETFDVLTEALEALATVKAAYDAATASSVSSLATTHVKLAIEIDRYIAEKKKAKEKEEEEDLFDD